MGTNRHNMSYKQTNLLNNKMGDGKGFKIVHVNVESISAHWIEIENIFGNGVADIICMSETFLKPEVSDRMFHIAGYNSFRNDRLNKIGGGVMLYVKSNLQFKVISKSPGPYTHKIEYLIGEVKVGKLKFLVGVVYRPPKTPLKDDFFDVLENIIPLYSGTIILGDFNVNLNDKNKSHDKVFLLQTLEQFNMEHLELGNTYHRVLSESSLDQIFTNMMDHIKDFGKMGVSGISNHDLIYCIFLDFPQPKIKR